MLCLCQRNYFSRKIHLTAIMTSSISKVNYLCAFSVEGRTKRSVKRYWFGSLVMSSSGLNLRRIIFFYCVRLASQLNLTITKTSRSKDYFYYLMPFANLVNK